MGRNPEVREPIMKKTVITDVQFLNLKSIGDAVDEEMRAEREETLSGPDSAAGRDLARAIGQNVARHRAERGFDLATLAQRSGIPEGDLRLVEAGDGLPGLRMIWQLASGLRVPFGALLAHTMLSEAADPDFRVQRSDRGRVVSTPEGLRSRALSSAGPTHGAPEVYDLTLAAGAVETAEPHAGETYEHIVVTAGQMRITVGDKIADLAAGDSIYFKADAPHRYENPASTDARALLIMIYG